MNEVVNEAVNEVVNRQNKIINAMRTKPEITIKLLVEQLGISRATVERDIKAMRDIKIKRVGSDKAGHWEVPDKCGKSLHRFIKFLSHSTIIEFVNTRMTLFRNKGKKKWITSYMLANNLGKFTFSINLRFCAVQRSVFIGD